MSISTTWSRGLVLLAVSLTSVAAPASAVTISFFANGSYVDMAREGPNLRADLVALGHTVTDFTGITAADFVAAGAAKVIVFPEMEDGELNPGLSAPARAALTAYVSGGGAIVQANAFESNTSLPNALFGYNLVQTGIGSTTLDAVAAAGTPFAGGPATLPFSNAVEGIGNASLPLGALNIYHDSSDSAVFMATFGAGRYVYLGFDWFEAPTPAEWFDVTGRAITAAVGIAQVPEPAPLALFAIGLAALGFARRSRTR